MSANQRFTLAIILIAVLVLCVLCPAVGLAFKALNAAPAEPTQIVVATEAPAEVTEAPAATEAPTEPPAQPDPADDRIAKLIKLDETYRSLGWEAWLRAAGITFDSTKVESRQPVEEVLSDHVTVVGLVIRSTELEVSWPSCITTDRPNEVTTSASTRQHQPDLRNPSILYTNAVLNGQATVYADCSDWGQLDPTNK